MTDLYPDMSGKMMFNWSDVDWAIVDLATLPWQELRSGQKNMLLSQECVRSALRRYALKHSVNRTLTVTHTKVETFFRHLPECESKKPRRMKYQTADIKKMDYEQRRSSDRMNTLEARMTHLERKVDRMEQSLPYYLADLVRDNLLLPMFQRFFGNGDDSKKIASRLGIGED